jgi:tRNA dimethylallyltransferase
MMFNTAANTLIYLMGPTASGKTDLAIELAHCMPSDIISVDSAMVYRGMDIGTAKPTPEQLKDTPHRLINICDPIDRYSVGQFVTEATREIDQIHAQQRIPLLVGGTMLYFRTLQKGITDLPCADTAVRRRLEEEAKQMGLDAMHARLAGIDPLAASRIDPHDGQRIQRALEVYFITGKPLSVHWAEDKENQFKKGLDVTARYRIVNIAVAPLDRQEIHARIALRFEQMLQNGFVEEVERLMKRGDLNPDLPSLRAVGYRQVWNYLQDKITFEEMRQQAIIATRQLAKRQLTWLRSWSSLQWFDSQSPTVLQDIQSYLNREVIAKI